MVVEVQPPEPDAAADAADAAEVMMGVGVLPVAEEAVYPAPVRSALIDAVPDPIVSEVLVLVCLAFFNSSLSSPDTLHTIENVVNRGEVTVVSM